MRTVAQTTRRTRARPRRAPYSGRHADRERDRPGSRRRRHLPRTLAALVAQECPGGFEVIVVDDGSSDATAQIVRDTGPPVSLVQQPALGPGVARTRGVEAAQTTRLAFCDADVVPAPGWLAAGVAALDAPIWSRAGLRPTLEPRWDRLTGRCGSTPRWACGRPRTCS